MLRAAALAAAVAGATAAIDGWSSKYILKLPGSGGVEVEAPTIMWGTAHKTEQTLPHTTDAIKLGYRGIDTANQPQHYNEAAVGAALAASYETHDLSRENFFLQSKFTPANAHGDAGPPYDAAAEPAEQVAQSLEQSLANLQTEYLDSYVLHDPMGSHDERMAVWRAMEAAYDAGTVKLLGISNVNKAQLEELVAAARVKPTFVQNRLRSSVDNWDAGVRAVCAANGLVYQGYSVIGSNRALLTEKAVLDAAAWHGVTPAQVLLKWALAQGVQAIVSPRGHRFKNDNLELGFTLSPQELAVISAFGHPERGLKVDGSTKVAAKFWNEMNEEVTVFWVDPNGPERESFRLPAGGSAEAAQVANTYHSHKFVIRGAAGNKLKEWTADATKGEEQDVPIDLQIKAVFQSMYHSPLTVYWVSPDTTEVENGRLEAPAGGSAGVQGIDVGTWHTHRFVCRDAAGRKVYQFAMDMAKGAFQVITVPRVRGERY